MLCSNVIAVNNATNYNGETSYNIEHAYGVRPVIVISKDFITRNKANYIELSLYDGIKGLYNFLRDISGKNDPILIMRAINITMRKIFAIDDLDKALSYYRAREIKFGDAEKNYKKALDTTIRAINVIEPGIYKKLMESMKR